MLLILIHEIGSGKYLFFFEVAVDISNGSQWKNLQKKTTRRDVIFIRIKTGMNKTDLYWNVVDVFIIESQ